MAVFYDTGGGDIYGGPDRKSILEAMIEDGGDEYDFDKEMFEVPCTTKMVLQDEDDMPTEELTTLEEEYSESLGAYCIASENC